MCRLLAELTNTDLRIMSETVSRLEKRAGLPGADIRLTADIHAQIHLKIRALGLDPHDTHPKELYVSLQNLAATHERFLLRKFSLIKPTDDTSLPHNVAFMFDRLKFNRRSWLLRSAALRRILQAIPPNRLVKQLGYRTSDSMIKREQVDTLLFLALHTEPQTWQQQLDKQLSQLSVTDFEERLIQIRPLEHARFREITSHLAEKHHSFVYGTPLVGSVFVLPYRGGDRPGIQLLALMMAIKEATELQYVHSFLRQHQMELDFSAKLPTLLRSRQTIHATIAGQTFDWRILHRHYGQESDPSRHPIVFQPHLQAEDLAYRRAEEVLFRVEPALHFWHQTDYVGLKTVSGSISFNLLDVLINLVNGVAFERQVSGHMQQAVWDELLLRYMRAEHIEQSVLHQLTESARVPDVEFV